MCTCQMIIFLTPYIYIYIYILSSRSDSTRLPDSLSLSLSLSDSIPILHCSWQVLQTASSVRTELLYVSLRWSANTGATRGSSPEEKGGLWVYPSSVVPRISCSNYLDSLWDGRQLVILWLFCGVLLPGFVPDFYMIDNLSIAFHSFRRHMLISLLVGEMLLPRYVKWFINLGDLLLKVEMAFFV